MDIRLANLAGEPRRAKLASASANEAGVSMLDETTLEIIVSAPEAFDASERVSSLPEVALVRYAVARLNRDH